MLRASRGVCVRGRIVGGIVVRVMLDYRTLPFISSQSAYLESLRPNRQVHAEGRLRARRRVRGLRLEPRADLRVGHERLDAARCGLRRDWWSRASRSGRRSTRNGQRFRVYFLSDRGGIYALGYPVITWAGHLINLAELVMLAAGALRAADRRVDRCSAR